MSGFDSSWRRVSAPDSQQVAFDSQWKKTHARISHCALQGGSLALGTDNVTPDLMK
jgi:hypothetical protein